MTKNPEKIAVEVAADQFALFRRAAEIQGRTVEQFVLGAAEMLAEEIVHWPAVCETPPRGIANCLTSNR